jgi:hypothetical protein
MPINSTAGVYPPQILSGVIQGIDSNNFQTNNPNSKWKASFNQ